MVMQVVIFEDRERDIGAVPCGTDPELFFAESAMDVERAKLLCSRCPVRASCLAGALERREPWGVWGGEVFEDGVIVARKRARGRPRKSERAVRADGVDKTDAVDGVDGVDRVDRADRADKAGRAAA